MRIGIISLYYESKNIGGLLQSYAMVKICEEMVDEAEQISYDCKESNTIIDEYLSIRRKALLKKSSCKMILNKIASIINDKVNTVSDRKFCNVKKQDDIFSEFEKSIPHSNKIYYEYNLEELNEKYDIFLVGSDQVWNTGLFARNAFFLNFTQKKKIAYAVSMGKTDVEERLFRERLKLFSEVGVREKSMIEAIERYGDVKCTVVLDPTLLLDYDDWRKIENKDLVPNHRYIFCYFLGDCVWQRKLVQKYAEKNDYTVIDLPYIMKRKRKSDAYLKGKHLVDVGPREFIALVKNAECVFTDSFHAMAFSLNFQTDFYVFDRDGLSGGESINSRIVDFLDTFSLSDRRITLCKEFKEDKIDWNNVLSILEIHKNKSREWLKNQIVL